MTIFWLGNSTNQRRYDETKNCPEVYKKSKLITTNIYISTLTEAELLNLKNTM